MLLIDRYFPWRRSGSRARERARARAPANRQLIDRPINHPRAFVPRLQDYSGCYPASDCTVPESFRSIAHRAVAFRLTTARRTPAIALVSVLRVLLRAAPRGEKLNRSFRRYIVERAAVTSRHGYRTRARLRLLNTGAARRSSASKETEPRVNGTSRRSDRRDLTIDTSIIHCIFNN